MIDAATVERAAQVANEHGEVVKSYVDGVDKARDAYLDAPEASKADAWRNYTHAMDQLAHANYRAGEAAKLAKAVANAYHLAQAWERLSQAPVDLPPTTELPELRAVPQNLVQ